MEKKYTEIKLERETIAESDQKMRELLELAQTHELPMFTSVVIQNNASSTQYDSIVFSAQAHNIELKDDKIRKYMLVANGFEPVPPRNIIKLEMETVSQDAEGTVLDK